MPLTDIPKLRRRLLAWFDRHRRDLPWRRTRDPYRIWLSEMMLQQTQVATALPYYERFLRAFPTLRALAAAKLDDVLALWAGLGYYARARNLHKAAGMIVSEYGGEMPATAEELRRLPGTGPYSAAAVASIVSDERAAAVDGNVARVISRLCAVECEVSSTPARRLIQQFADQLMPPRRCGDFNQAMIELGATVCLPGSAAACTRCPLMTHCEAMNRGIVGRLPLKKKKTAVRAETHVVAAIERAGRWLVIQRPSGGLWGGLWELPSEVANGAALDIEAVRIAERQLGRPLRHAPSQFCDVQRLLTHRRIRFIGYRIDMIASPSSTRCRPGTMRPRGEQASRWLTMRQLRDIPMSTAMREVVAALEMECRAANPSGARSRKS